MTIKISFSCGCQSSLPAFSLRSATNPDGMIMVTVRGVNLSIKERDRQIEHPKPCAICAVGTARGKQEADALRREWPILERDDAEHWIARAYEARISYADRLQKFKEKYEAEILADEALFEKVCLAEAILQEKTSAAWWIGAETDLIIHRMAKPLEIREQGLLRKIKAAFQSAPESK